MNNDMVKELFENYGRVDKCQYQFGKRFRKYKRLKNSGYRTLWMEVAHPIPSSPFINQTETYIYVTHAKQQVTCHKCGKSRPYSQEMSCKKDIISK
jgi:hypothetical protein